MKKTSLILIMLMFVMSTNIFAQANRARTGAARKTTTVKKTTPTKSTTPAKPIEIKPVDMGLSVKWASSPLGTTAANKPGKFITVSEAEKKCKELGEGWRLPTMEEIKELIGNCYDEIIVSNGKPIGIRCWSKKNHATVTFYFAECSMYVDGKKNGVNPSYNNGNEMYSYAIPSTQGCWFTGAVKIQQAIKQQIYSCVGNVIKGLGKNYGEWPDEAKEDLENILLNIDSRCIGVSADFSYIGSAESLDVGGWKDTVKLIFTPVYDVNDDE